MTLPLAFGLLLQALAIATFSLALRGSVWHCAGFYLVLGAVVFSGGAEVIRVLRGTPIPTRTGNVDPYVPTWNVIVGGALLLFTAGYLLGNRRSSRAIPYEGEGNAVLRFYDWKILAAFTAPLVVIAGRGGYSSSYTADALTAAQTQSGLVGQFVVLGVTLTGIAFIGRHPRAFVPAYVIQLVAIVLVGQRLDVVTVAIATVVGLAVIGRRPRAKSVVAVLICAALLVMSLNSVRAQFGRETYTSATSVVDRLRLVALGAVDLVEQKPVQYTNDTEPIAQRIDGNTFPAGELQALDHGSQPVGLATLLNDIQLAVPSYIDPAKLSSDRSQRVEKLYENDQFSLGYVNDFIPTQLGAALGYFGAGGLLLFALLLGSAYGTIERLCAKRVTPARFLVTLALTICALSYERSNEVYPLTARGVLVVLVGFAVVAWFRSMKRAPDDPALALARR